MTKICENCGKEFEVDPHKTGQQNNCPDCTVPKKRHGNQGNVYKKQPNPRILSGKPTDCICPNCRKPHKKYGAHKWSYCRACEAKLNHTYSDAYGQAM